MVAKEDYWPTYQGDIVWNNEHMRQKKKERPNRTLFKPRWTPQTYWKCFVVHVGNPDTLEKTVPMFDQPLRPSSCDPVSM